MRLLFVFLFFLLVELFQVQAFLAPLSPQHDLPGTPPPVGSIWPRPQTHSQNPRFVAVDTANINIAVRNSRGEAISCSNLDWAVSHYNNIIASLNQERVEGGISAVDVIINGDNRCDEAFRGGATDEEYYELDVTEDARVQIQANYTGGAIRALETFYQLLWPANEDYSLYNVNVTHIADFPRFPHRGMMLDGARHYLPEKMIIKILTIMMYNKFNVFHWHVIDDQSFPYVSRKFPELSDKGAYSKRQIYTPETVRRVIDAARVRGIRVILEFDTPGHVYAIGKSHREILTPCYGDGQTPGTPNPPFHADYENIDPTNEKSYEFMREFFTEVVETVPNITHIHLGMDEVYAPCWNSSPVIKDFMRENGYVNLSQVQGHYTTRHIQMVKSLNVSMIAWQDPLDEGVELDKDVIIQVWKDWIWQSSWTETLNKGYKVLLSACWYVNYIEYGETWRKYFECDPIGNTHVPESQWNQILGGEAAIWGEFVDQTNIVSRLFPFSSAVASVLWDSNIGNGSGREDTDDAMHRLDAFRCSLLRRGVRAQPIMNGHCGPFETSVQLNY